MLTAAMPDVIANVIGVGKREDDEIMSLAVAECARARRFRFLVFGFSVNNGSRRFAGVLAHALPNAHHVATSGIDDLAAAILDLLQDRQFGSESGNDDNVVRLQIRNLRLLVLS